MTTNMNGVESLSNVIIKRNKNARKLSFTDPQDVEHFTKILSSIETLRV